MYILYPLKALQLNRPGGIICKKGFKRNQLISKPKKTEINKYSRCKHKNAGILRGEIMDDKLMYIPDYDTQNYLFFTLKLVVPTFKHCN